MVLSSAAFVNAVIPESIAELNPANLIARVESILLKSIAIPEVNSFHFARIPLMLSVLFVIEANKGCVFAKLSYTSFPISLFIPGLLCSALDITIS